MWVIERVSGCVRLNELGDDRHLLGLGNPADRRALRFDAEAGAVLLLCGDTIVGNSGFHTKGIPPFALCMNAQSEQSNCFLPCCISERTSFRAQKGEHRSEFGRSESLARCFRMTGEDVACRRQNARTERCAPRLAIQYAMSRRCGRGAQSTLQRYAICAAPKQPRGVPRAREQAASAQAVWAER
jgi:hypothetical protein